MGVIEEKITFLFKGIKGISLAYWDNEKNRICFFKKKTGELYRLAKYIGTKLSSFPSKLAKRNSFPISIDNTYIHGFIIFPANQMKSVKPLIELFSDFYFGIYLQTAFKRSMEIKTQVSQIYKLTDEKMIIEKLEEALSAVLDASETMLLEGKPFNNVNVSGQFPDLTIDLPIRYQSIVGIRILSPKKILPNEISIRFLESLLAQAQHYLDLQVQLKTLNLTERRYKFLSNFSAQFHDISSLSQLRSHIEENLGAVLEVQEVEFLCFHKEDLATFEAEFRKARESYICKRTNRNFKYEFPVYSNNRLSAVLIITRPRPLTNDDLLFTSFLINETGIIINLHAHSKNQEKRMDGLKTANEILDLYPSLATTEDAYRILAEKICKKVNFDMGGFVLISDDEFIFSTSCFFGWEEASTSCTLKIKDTEILYGVYHSRKPYYTNHLENLPFTTKKLLSKFGIDKFICLPLVFKNEIIGIFTAARTPRSPRMTDEDLGLMSVLCNQSAILIQSLKSSEELNRQINELKLLNEISRIANSTLYLNEIVRSTLHKLRSFVSHPYISFYIYNELSNNLELVGYLGYRLPDPSYRYMKPGIGIVGNTAMIRMPIVVDSVEDDNRYIRMLNDVESELAIPIIFQEKMLGVLDIQSRVRNAFKPSEVALLNTVANQLASAIENALLHERVEETLTDAVRALVMAIDAADPHTRGHSERVTDYAVEISIELGLPRNEIEKIKKAALLHDIGKIGISELILLKKEKLTNEEMDEVKIHPLLGAQMLDGVRGFEEIRNLIKSHHEGYNGDGYPYGLRGEEIPLGARIITVADVYEALTSDRPYRPAYSKAQAIEILKSESGGHLDPRIVSVLIKILNKKE
ncbi:MAG TPA: GAF domain-containing protein [bacterium (Candidatus Stahlbacteria)]|nr:GAF domain-containing protein [Candidatus Stahlbacteria bacterium]